MLEAEHDKMNFRSHDTETFDTLLGDSQDQEQLPLENYKDVAGETNKKNDEGEEHCDHVVVAGEASPQTPGKKETKGRKRKAEEERSKKQSEYQQRQEELARRMEESGEQPIRSLTLAASDQ